MLIYFRWYYEYDNEIYDKIHYLKDKINTSKDLKKNDHEIKNLEREITMFHAKVTNEMTKKSFVESFLSSVRSKMYRNRK